MKEGFPLEHLPGQCGPEGQLRGVVETGVSGDDVLYLFLDGIYLGVHQSIRRRN